MQHFRQLPFTARACAIEQLRTCATVLDGGCYICQLEGSGGGESCLHSREILFIENFNACARSVFCLGACRPAVREDALSVIAQQVNLLTLAADTMKSMSEAGAVAFSDAERSTLIFSAYAGPAKPQGFGFGAILQFTSLQAE